jgi:hypothetical protein
MLSALPSANVAASAAKTTTSDQASVADALLIPSERARSHPGASTRAVAAASLT